MRVYSGIMKKGLDLYNTKSEVPLKGNNSLYFSK